ncbi:hypothetical protein NDA11_003871 [Ustilago hordei]|nr:hypothetical protein NDA11_003871 [Ustilago hordei]
MERLSEPSGPSKTLSNLSGADALRIAAPSARNARILPLSTIHTSPSRLHLHNFVTIALLASVNSDSVHSIHIPEAMSGWTTIWVFLIAAGASGAVWVTTPKGPNQVLIRTSVTIALTCMYLMWFIIYMAQLHPIVKPKRGDVRFLEH